MTEIEIAYLAGFLEGEGCFSMKDVSPLISFTQADEDVVRKVQSIMGGIIYRRKNKIYNKYYFELRLHGPRAIEVMKIIRPLMGMRRGKKIDEVIADDASRARRNFKAVS